MEIDVRQEVATMVVEVVRTIRDSNLGGEVSTATLEAAEELLESEPSQPRISPEFKW